MKDLIAFSARILLSILAWFAWDASYIYFSMTHLTPETKKFLEDSDTYYLLSTYGDQISMTLLVLVWALIWYSPIKSLMILAHEHEEELDKRSNV